MKYDDKVEGYFRSDYNKPNVAELSKFLYEQRKDRGTSSVGGAAFIIFFIVGCIAVAILSRLGNDNLPTLIMSLIAIVSCVFIKINADTRKFKFDNYVVIEIAFSVVAIYNILRLVNVLPASNYNADMVMASFFGILGIGVFINGLAKCIKYNFKCRSVADAECIGYLDKVVNVSSGHHNHTSRKVASHAVYTFEASGRTYTAYNPKYKTNEAFLPAIGSHHDVRYDENNPDFHMFKKAEISSFVISTILLVVFGVLAIGSINNANSINKEQTTIYTEPTIASESVLEDIEVTLETTVTETKAPGYTDEDIINSYGTEDYVVYVYEVVEEVMDGYFYFGEVPGLYSRLLCSDTLEVGDEVMFINFTNGSYVTLKLEDGKSYLGNKTAAELGYLDENGKIILSDDYLREYVVGSVNYTCDYVKFDRIEDNHIYFYNDEFTTYYDYNPETDMAYWDYEEGAEYVMIYDINGYGGIFSLDLYSMPE